MNCDWCKSIMNDEAVVCPACNRERKDFHNLKISMYVFISISLMTYFYAIGSGAWSSLFINEFEFSRIFTTFSGWICLISFTISNVLYIKASKIIKTWWWY